MWLGFDEPRSSSKAFILTTFLSSASEVNTGEQLSLKPVEYLEMAVFIFYRAPSQIVCSRFL